MYIATTAVRKLSNLHKRIKGVQGGTSASKTISILQILIDQCQRDKSPYLTSVTSESMPHLRRGAIRDFKNIMMEQNYWVQSRWNETNSFYTFETGSILEFFSLDMPHKVRGPRRRRLFINEANNIPYETFDQLEVRTEESIWLDWNPVSEFWWHEQVLGHQDVDSIILTYKDNEGLSQAIIDSIESRRDNKTWWQVYGLGQMGEVEGRIFKGWQIIDEIPFEARLERYGLDFGFTNDPTASDGIYKYNGGLIIDEVIHQKGLVNSEIAAIYKNIPRALIKADSAVPKDIAELHAYGLLIQPANKGKDSVNHGIQLVQDQKISITKRSVNTIKEYRNYLWMTDKDGRVLNVPSPYNNHHMDDIRYAIESMEMRFTWKQPTSFGGVKPYIPGTLV